MSQEATAAAEKILLIDDDPNILSGIVRNLRLKFNLITLSEPAKAFEMASNEGPFAVIVSDLHMPQIDGNALLRRMRDEHPDSVRILLTGQGDLDSATRAINEGSVFRFLTKPCPPHDMESVFNAAIRQYRLVTAERVLLQDTLNGCIKVLTDVLSLVNPLAFGRAVRVSKWAKLVATELKMDDVWQLEMSAMLSQIGCVAVPSDLLEKTLAAAPLTKEEYDLYTAHAQLGKQLISRIPRLEAVAEIIGQQFGNAKTTSPTTAAEKLTSANVLRLLLELDALEFSGKSRKEALASLAKEKKGELAAVVAVLAKLQDTSDRREKQICSMSIKELRPGMNISQDVCSKNGILLVSRGQEVTEAMIQLLRNYGGGSGVQEPVIVRING